MLPAPCHQRQYRKLQRFALRHVYIIINRIVIGLLYEMRANEILKSHDNHTLTTIFIIVSYYELGIKFSLADCKISEDHYSSKLQWKRTQMLNTSTG